MNSKDADPETADLNSRRWFFRPDIGSMKQEGSGPVASWIPLANYKRSHQTRSALLSGDDRCCLFHTGGMRYSRDQAICLL